MNTAMEKGTIRWRLIGGWAAGLGALLGGALLYASAHRPLDRCDSYTPVDAPLIAHAGGGLPDSAYANSRAALDLAARHGFAMIELDFIQRGNRLAIQHEGYPESDLSLADLMIWLDRHPGILIVTDMKTDNVAGLSLLKQAAGDRTARFVQQIYATDEYRPVIEMGFPAPIFTVYRLPQGAEPIETLNALKLRAVTMPVERRELAGQIDHPVFLHTVNEPLDGFGLYTDCLIPARRGRSAPRAR